MNEEVKNNKMFDDEDVYQKVPEESTYGWPGFFVIFIGMWTALVALGSGMSLGMSLTPWKACLGIFLGYMICMVYGYFVGRIGVMERLSTYPILRRPFSDFWVFLPAAFMWLIASTFIGIQADAATRILMAVTHFEEVSVIGFITNRTLLSALLCTFMMITAYNGIKYIKTISWVSMPLYLSAILIFFILTIKAYNSGGLGAILVIPKSQVSFASSVFMGVALYAGFTGCISDVSRFVKTKKDLKIAMFFGYILASLVPIAGIIMGAATNNANYWEIFSMFGLGVGIFAIIAFFLAQWTTNDNNAFTAGLALSTVLRALHPKFSIFPIMKRRGATLIPIVIGITMAALGSGAMAPLLAAVGALGSWLPSMSGIMLGHYYIVEKKAKKQVQAKGLAAVLAWLIISITVQLGILPWASITGVLGALVLYVILYYAVEVPLLGVKGKLVA